MECAAKERRNKELSYTRKKDKGEKTRANLKYLQSSCLKPIICNSCCCATGSIDKKVFCIVLVLKVLFVEKD